MWPSFLCICASLGFLMGTPVTLISYDLILTNYTCKDPISKQGHILRFWVDMRFEETKLILQSVETQSSPGHVSWWFSFTPTSSLSLDSPLAFIQLKNTAVYFYIYLCILQHMGSLVEPCKLLVVAWEILSSETRDQTWTPCIGSTECQPPDHLGNPLSSSFLRLSLVSSILPTVYMSSVPVVLHTIKMRHIL